MRTCATKVRRQAEHRRRLGMMTLEAVTTLAVLMLIAVVTFTIGVRVVGALYHVISSLVGSPYL